MINNSIYEMVLAGTVFLLLLVLLLLVKAFLARQLHQLAGTGRLRFLGYPEAMLQSTRLPFLIAVSALAVVGQLEISSRGEKWLHYAWIIILVSQIALWCARTIEVAVAQAQRHTLHSSPDDISYWMLLGLVGRVVVWSIALLIALDNLGFNISALMASLGIGGIAVALAAQNILGDLFSSVSIALDKPFVVGDFIVIDDYMGTVEYIGMKTTRLRSLGGEQIIFSNTELLKNRIRNYKRMQERRVQFEFGIAYDTAQEKVAHIPAMVEAIILRNQPGVRFGRTHFKTFGDSALLFDAVYFVLDPDYDVYMNIQQAINLALLQSFREQGIVFAYPTRTLYLVPPT